MQQAPGTELTSLIAWFREGSDADHSARLAFTPTLPKAQRAKWATHLAILVFHNTSGKRT